MKPGYKLTALVTLAAIGSISLIPKPVMAVPAMSWIVRNFETNPYECSVGAAKLMQSMGLSPTKEGNLVKGFTQKTGVVVICNYAKGNGCNGMGSVASVFITSDDSRERDVINRTMLRFFKVPMSVCVD